MVHKFVHRRLMINTKFYFLLTVIYLKVIYYKIQINHLYVSLHLEREKKNKYKQITCPFLRIKKSLNHSNCLVMLIFELDQQYQNMNLRSSSFFSHLLSVSENPQAPPPDLHNHHRQRGPEKKSKERGGSVDF